MSTGKHPLLFVLLTSTLLVTSCAAQIKPNVDTREATTAWWYNLSLTPKATTLLGLNTQQIDANWLRAEPLTLDNLQPNVSAEELQELLTSKLSLMLDIDLDDDGTVEHLFVGFYQTIDGIDGRFIAISKHNRVIAHFNEETSSSFSAMLAVGNAIRWYKCLQCGEFESIRWNGDSYALE